MSGTYDPMTAAPPAPSASKSGYDPMTMAPPVPSASKSAGTSYDPMTAVPPNTLTPEQKKAQEDAAIASLKATSDRLNQAAYDKAGGFPAANSFLRGLTAGVIDPAQAYLQSHLPEHIGPFHLGGRPGVSYDQALHDIQAARDTFQAEHPLVDAGANLGGNIVQTVAGLKGLNAVAPAVAAAASRTALQRGALTLANSGAQGALNGYTQAAPGNQAQDARYGAATGTILGGLAGMGAKMGAIGGAGLNRAGTWAATHGILDPEAAAGRDFASMLGNEGYAPKQAAAVLAQRSGTNIVNPRDPTVPVPSTQPLAIDMIGPSDQSTVHTALKVATPARVDIARVINDREATQPDRIASYIKDTISPNADVPFTSFKDMNAAYKAQVSPLYEQARTAGVLNPDYMVSWFANEDSPARQSMLNTFQRMRAGNNMAPGTTMRIGESLPGGGFDLTTSPNPSVQDLLDFRDIVSKSKAAAWNQKYTSIANGDHAANNPIVNVLGQPMDLPQVTKFGNDLTTMIDRVTSATGNPEDSPLFQARKIASSHFDDEAAYNIGRVAAHNGMTANELGSHLDDLNSQSSQEAMRLGFGGETLRRVQSSKNPSTRADIISQIPLMQDKMALLYRDPASRDYMNWAMKQAEAPAMRSAQLYRKELPYNTDDYPIEGDNDITSDHPVHMLGPVQLAVGAMSGSPALMAIGTGRIVNSIKATPNDKYQGALTQLLAMNPDQLAQWATAYKPQGGWLRQGYNALPNGSLPNALADTATSDDPNLPTPFRPIDRPAVTSTPPDDNN